MSCWVRMSCQLPYFINSSTAIDTKLRTAEMDATKLSNYYMHKCIWLNIQKRGIIKYMFRIHKSHLKARNKCASENLANSTKGKNKNHNYLHVFKNPQTVIMHTLREFILSLTTVRQLAFKENLSSSRKALNLSRQLLTVINLPHFRVTLFKGNFKN